MAKPLVDDKLLASHDNRGKLTFAYDHSTIVQIAVEIQKKVNRESQEETIN